MEMDVFLSACIVIGLLSSRLVGLVIEQRRKREEKPLTGGIRMYVSPQLLYPTGIHTLCLQLLISSTD